MRTPVECAAFMIFKYKARIRATEKAAEYAMNAGIDGNSWAWNYWQSVLNELEKSETMHD